ncbi:MAG: hypothetical protein ACT443_07235 [Gemmatimonadota bacterium]
MNLRVGLAILASSAAVAACNGWPGTVEFEKAEHKPEKYVTYSAVPPDRVQTFAFGNRTWMAEPATLQLRGAKLQTVGAVGSVTLLAPAGAQAPYDVLFTPAGGTSYRRVVPVN